MTEPEHDPTPAEMKADCSRGEHRPVIVDNLGPWHWPLYIYECSVCGEPMYGVPA
jgi:hypothetical protein